MSMDYPVALYLQDAHPIQQGIELVRYAESKGFDAVWQADSRLVRDALRADGGVRARRPTGSRSARA